MNYTGDSNCNTCYRQWLNDAGRNATPQPYLARTKIEQVLIRTEIDEVRRIVTRDRKRLIK